MQAEKNGVADYLAQVPSEHLEALGELRAACLDELLGYEESISYGIRYRRPAQIDMDVVRSILRATVASKGPVC